MTTQAIANKPFLSVAEAAQCLGITRRTAYDWATDGVLPVTVLHHRMVVPTAALEQWINRKNEEALAASS
jgi:excisionase family DNA binding protein